MKHFIIALTGLFFVSPLLAQHPVEWSFYSKKISGNTYEIHLLATIDKDWHVYSQHSSKKGPSPAAISIVPATNVRLQKGVKEEGALIKRKNTENISVQYFENRLTFVQTVTLTGSVSEPVKGTISYVAASASKTLPPQDVDFSVRLEQ